MPRLKGESKNFIDRTKKYPENFEEYLVNVLSRYDIESNSPPHWFEQAQKQVNEASRHSRKENETIAQQEEWMWQQKRGAPYGPNDPLNPTMEQVYKRIADQLFIESIKRQGGFYPSPEAIIKRNKK